MVATGYDCGCVVPDCLFNEHVHAMGVDDDCKVSSQKAGCWIVNLIRRDFKPEDSCIIDCEPAVFIAGDKGSCCWEVRDVYRIKSLDYRSFVPAFFCEKFLRVV